MSERLWTSSIFRKPVDQSILTENKHLVQMIHRRHVCAAPSASAPPPC